MKVISTLTLAALLASGSAMAADATMTAPAAKPASHATPVDHHCRDGANEKKLAGAARKSFMKKCLADAKATK